MKTFREASDRTLYWTLSFYLPTTQLPTAVRDAILKRLKAKPDDTNSFAVLFAADADVGALHRAMTPLFNDISNQRWVVAGASDEYLLNALSGHEPLHVTVSTPEVICWTVEGLRFAIAPGRLGPQAATVRRFWYVHSNGAISWHVSISVPYAHTPAHFCFLAMLQQVLSPTDFATADHPLMRTHSAVSPPFQMSTGLQPLDDVTITADGDTAPFWNTLTAWFNRDAPLLMDRMAGTGWRTDDAACAADPWRALVRTEANPEIPGLALPICRSLFVFDDSVAFAALLPKLDPASGTLQSLEARVEALYAQPPEPWISPDVPDGVYQFDERFWRQSTRSGDESDATTGTAQRSDASTPEDLLHRFMAAFHQGHIDMLNMDPNEILDALQSIEFQDAQRQHSQLRFANSRAIFQYASGPRSLMVGLDYISTCPYAFLIHASLLHNECLAVDFQRDSAETLKDIQTLIDADKSGAMDVLNRFRLREESRFRNAFHTNLFRFDSEADAFEQIEQRRGVGRLVRNVEARVDILERQLPVFEERLRRQRDKAVSYAIAAVGAFGLFQLVLQTVDMLHPVSAPWRLPAVWASSLGSAIIMLAFLSVVAADLWTLRPRRGSTKRKRPQSEAQGPSKA